MPAPITSSAIGLDLSSRIVASTTVVASPADATETIICSLTIPGGIAIVAGVLLLCVANFTVGTNGVSGNLKIRRTNAAGATVTATGAINVGTWAATNLAQLVALGNDTGPADGQVYVATLTVGSASAASTVSAVALRAIAI
jgi:hypothetical protein